MWDVRIKLGTDRKIIRKVFLRDRGVCQQCSTDMELIQHLYNLLDCPEDRQLARERWLVPAANDYGRWWTIDHIRPLSQGGDSTMLNLQTLCGPCHVEKSETDLTAHTWSEPETSMPVTSVTDQAEYPPDHSL